MRSSIILSVIWDKSYLQFFIALYLSTKNQSRAQSFCPSYLPSAPKAVRFKLKRLFRLEFCSLEGADRDGDNVISTFHVFVQDFPKVLFEVLHLLRKYSILMYKFIPKVSICCGLITINHSLNNVFYTKLKETLC